jgi:hypothetical protein
MKKMIIILLFQIVLSLQVQVMAKEVWVFGTKEQVFTQAYKIENSWTYAASISLQSFFCIISCLIAFSDCSVIASASAKGILTLRKSVLN